MGWFEHPQKTYLTEFLFSSPLGDGLVQRKIIMANTNLRNFGFSSPLGDGLVLVCYVSYVILWKIFVPAWGWVGSYNSRKEGYQRTDFRPRVGMGWFQLKLDLSTAGTSCHFRPRVGMGWFSHYSIIRRLVFHFRPRVGMGWFCT